MSQKKIIGILLAGGKGTRLKELTDSIPKPALQFGGKYRVIDFVLSNCTNSGIDTIGIITQYEPIELTSYIGSGSAWDLDIVDGGVTVLPPYTSKQEGFYWQKGTAHAVYQHLNYIDLYHPEVVLILSTDHIYKMDYNDLIDLHSKKNADLTIASLRIDKKEAYRFGMLETDSHDRVLSFMEKPQTTNTNKACMGVYLFNYQTLKQTLIQFTNHESKKFDFGEDIIPYLIKHYNVYSYTFEDYWRDIGTIDALWKTNMELIDHPEYLNLSDRKWPVFSHATHLPPHHAFASSLIKNSIVSEGSLILGNVYHSIISSNVVIGKNTRIINCVVMPEVTIGENCMLKNVIVIMNITIPNNTVICQEDEIILLTEDILKEVGQ